MIAKGTGMFSDMIIPGRDELKEAPKDWPTELQPGTLNVRIDNDGYPAENNNQWKTERIPLLDTGIIPSCFVIPQDKFVNNSIAPMKNQPDRGNAQVWRAHLRVVISRQELLCWVLRRIGSGMQIFLEIVSNLALRDKYGLQDEQEVLVIMYEA
ncbi:MAG: hypothetical protein IIA60_12730 [Candidatus Marinimicrobia bacterium]|nr:hypothetical protein [Candidatus Neomarinimicrobiota bacterium]